VDALELVVEFLAEMRDGGQTHCGDEEEEEVAGDDVGPVPVGHEAVRGGVHAGAGVDIDEETVPEQG
jgi:hypothetical protein